MRNTDCKGCGRLAEHRLPAPGGIENYCGPCFTAGGFEREDRMTPTPTHDTPSPAAELLPRVFTDGELSVWRSVVENAVSGHLMAANINTVSRFLATIDARTPSPAAVETVRKAILADFQRVKPLCGAMMNHDPETDVVDFDGQFRPIEVARAILAALSTAAPTATPDEPMFPASTVRKLWDLKEHYRAEATATPDVERVLLQEAREAAISVLMPDDAEYLAAIRAGKWDNLTVVQVALAALQRRATLPTVPADLLALREKVGPGPFYVQLFEEGDAPDTRLHVFLMDGADNIALADEDIRHRSDSPAAELFAALVNWFDTLPSSDVGAVPDERAAIVAMLDSKAKALTKTGVDQKDPSHLFRATELRDAADAIERGEHLSTQPENGGSNG